MIVLTSALPPSRVPVRAVTVTSEVMSEPELVMNCFAPLTRQWPSTSSAFVRVAPASEPGPGSVSPKPASGAAARSRQPEAGGRPAGHRVRQPLLLLLVGAEGEDRVDAEPHGRFEG